MKDNNYKQNDDNFKRNDYHIYVSSKKLHLYIAKFISPLIPKVYSNIRVGILDECYELIKNIYSSYYNEGNIRKKYVNASCVSISIINHYVSMLDELDIIKGKVLKTLSYYLSDVKISLFAWRNKINSG